MRYNRDMFLFAEPLRVVRVHLYVNGFILVHRCKSRIYPFAVALRSL